jgi:hypothetical protein
MDSMVQSRSIESTTAVYPRDNVSEVDLNGVQAIDESTRALFKSTPKESQQGSQTELANEEGGIRFEVSRHSSLQGLTDTPPLHSEASLQTLHSDSASVHSNQKSKGLLEKLYNSVGSNGSTRRASSVNSDKSSLKKNRALNQGKRSQSKLMQHVTGFMNASGLRQSYSMDDEESSASTTRSPSTEPPEKDTRLHVNSNDEQAHDENQSGKERRRRKSNVSAGSTLSVAISVTPDTSGGSATRYLIPFVPLEPDRPTRSASATNLTTAATTPATETSLSLDENVHVGWLTPPMPYPYCLRLDPIVFQWTSVQRDRPMYHEAHELVRVYGLSISEAVEETDETEIPLGLCAVCHEAVHVPLIADAQAHWLSGTVPQTTFVETKPHADVFRISQGHQCRGCSMIVHADCCSTDTMLPGFFCPRVMDERKVQESFLRFWTSCLKDYRSFIIHDDIVPPSPDMAPSRYLDDKKPPLGFKKKLKDDAPGMCPVFRKAEFLAQEYDRDRRTFLSGMLDSQAFVQFAHDRQEKLCHDYEVLFFDEAIKAKLNRSKIKLSKESTPFLRVRCIFDEFDSY